jgi:hypothetical protein
MTPDRRRDRTTSARLELALFLNDMIGSQHSARMLARHNVPLAVALRVLTRPGARRIE